jgi:hypothetical protein
MNPEAQRKFNLIFGGMFLALGIVTWLMAVFFAVVPNQPAPAPLMGTPSIDIPSCRAAMQQLGYTGVSSANENEVSAHEDLTVDVKGQLEKASIGALVCKLKLQSFCMGPGCERPGLSFTLRRPVEAKRTVEPAIALVAATTTPATTTKAEVAPAKPR